MTIGMRVGLIVVATCAWGLVARGGDDEVGVPVGPRPAAPPGIDLAAHVDMNVVLPPKNWRVGGGQIVLGGFGGQVRIDGNLTIGGEPNVEPQERARRTTRELEERLRKAQAERLAAVAADPAISAGRRRSLELATETDIRRVLAEVARERERYAGQRANVGDENWQGFARDVDRCRQSIADPFGPGSLFAAVQAGIAADAARAPR